MRNNMLVRKFQDRIFASDEVMPLIYVNKGITESSRYVPVDLGDDQFCGEGSRFSIAYRHSKTATPVSVGRRKLDHRYI